jgi:hypothetical protein
MTLLCLLLVRVCYRLNQGVKSIASQLRYPHDSETSWAQRLKNNDDLYPYGAKQNDKASQKSIGFLEGGSLLMAAIRILPDT